MQDLQMADPFGVVNAKAAIWHLLSHLSPSSAEWVQKSQYHLTWRITPPPDQIPFPIPAPLRQAGEKGGESHVDWSDWEVFARCLCAGFRRGHFSHKRL